MELAVIRIGNSKGIRLSKTILDRYNIKEKVELVFEEEGIVLKPVRLPRQGWEDKLKEMHQTGDDNLLIPDVSDEDID